jgi:hypothetical protein
VDVPGGGIQWDAPSTPQRSHPQEASPSAGVSPVQRRRWPLQASHDVGLHYGARAGSRCRMLWRGSRFSGTGVFFYVLARPFFNLWVAVMGNFLSDESVFSLVESVFYGHGPVLLQYY